MFDVSRHPCNGGLGGVKRSRVLCSLYLSCAEDIGFMRASFMEWDIAVGIVGDFSTWPATYYLFHLQRLTVENFKLSASSVI